MIQVNHLKTWFKTDEGMVKAVDDISFTLNQTEVLALVGESGCGKSVTVLTLMGLVKSPPAKIEGEILYKGRNLRNLSKEEYRHMRGKEFGMIFQEPMSSFDPLYTIGDQMTEALRVHYPITESEAKKQAIEMLQKVGIPEAKRRANEYPHQMSGGMLQRVMIALTLSLEPNILIADEPSTALDVTIQAQVLSLMKKLQKETGTSILFITHDLGVVAEVADRIHVMYAGWIVEKATVVELFKRPLHPYTQGLLKSRVQREYKGKTLPFIPGYVPRAYEFPEGCRFHPRCPKTMDICAKTAPPAFEPLFGREVKCWLYEKGDIQ